MIPFGDEYKSYELSVLIQEGKASFNPWENEMATEIHPAYPISEAFWHGFNSSVAILHGIYWNVSDQNIDMFFFFKIVKR